MTSGTGPTKPRHTDYDYIKSHHAEVYAGSILPPTFPQEFFTKKDPVMPDQNASGQPTGCTNFSQVMLKSILRGEKFSLDDVQKIESVTHANARGGCSIRESLDACLPPNQFTHPDRLGWIAQYYNIRSSGRISAFKAFQLAQISGLLEERAITFGTPWFPSWAAAMSGNKVVYRKETDSFEYSGGGTKTGRLPIPSDDELRIFRKDPMRFPWHDSVLDGFSSLLPIAPGVPLYRDESWQGTNVGDNGYLYFDEATINVVESLAGTVAYTATLTPLYAPERIDLTVVQWIVSFIRKLYNV